MREYLNVRFQHSCLINFPLWRNSHVLLWSLMHVMDKRCSFNAVAAAFIDPNRTCSEERIWVSIVMLDSFHAFWAFQATKALLRVRSDSVQCEKTTCPLCGERVLTVKLRKKLFLHSQSDRCCGPDRSSHSHISPGRLVGTCTCSHERRT